MRILMAADVYPPQISGGSRHVQLLSYELIKRGHSVAVCTTAIPGQLRYERSDALQVYREQCLFSRIPFIYRSADRFPAPIPDLLLVKQLKNILQRGNIDIVHAHGWIVQSVISALKEFNAPLIVTLHDYRAICPAAGMVSNAAWCSMQLNRHCVACSHKLYGFGPLGRLKSLATYLATRANKNKLHSVSKFIAVSSFVKQAHLKAMNLPDEDIVVIPNFYGDGMDDAASEIAELPEDYLLFVGRLCPEKGVDILIDAYRKLDTGAKLVLIGANHINHYADKDKTLVIENAPHPVVIQALRNCRFAIFPSIWPESCATVALEAMSCKKAIITSNLGGFTDIVANGETGILVPPNDVMALYQAVRYLLENPTVAIKMGQKGYERWKKMFCPDVVIPRIELLYKSLI